MVRRHDFASLVSSDVTSRCCLTNATAVALSENVIPKISRAHYWMPTLNRINFGWSLATHTHDIKARISHLAVAMTGLTLRETLIYLHGLRQEPTPSEFDDAAADTDRV